MLDFLLNVYLTSSALSLCMAIMYLGKFKRIKQVYELELYLDAFSVIVLVVLSFIPIVNLYTGATSFNIGVIGSDKEFIEALLGIEDEEGDK